MRACLLFVAAVSLMAADVEPVKSTKPSKEAEPSAGQRPPEESWTFDPVPNRLDPFADVEQSLALEASLRESTDRAVTAVSTRAPGPNQDNKLEEALQWGHQEIDRIEKLILARRWSEAISGCDSAAKTLEKYGDAPQIVELRESLARFRHQALEAKLFEEAQAQFDALGIAVEGVLWAPEGSLAVISGEPRALRVNDFTRGCTIVNIDTNRVDFLFTTEQKRRYEFQRYVGAPANGNSR